MAGSDDSDFGAGLMNLLSIFGAGALWPKLSQQGLYAAQAEWVAFAGEIRDVASLGSAVSASVGSGWGGVGGAQYARAAGDVFGSGDLEALAGAADQVAGYLNDFGVKVEYAKRMIVAQLVIMVAMLVQLAAISWLFPPAAAAAEAVVESGQLFVRRVLLTLLADAVEGGVSQIAAAAIIQKIQIDERHRASFSVDLLKDAAIGAAIGVGVGAAFGVGGAALGGLGKAFGKDVGQGVGKDIGNDLGRGVGNDLGNGLGKEFGGLGSDLGNGLGKEFGGLGNDLGEGFGSGLGKESGGLGQGLGEDFSGLGKGVVGEKDFSGVVGDAVGMAAVDDVGKVVGTSVAKYGGAAGLGAAQGVISGVLTAKALGQPIDAESVGLAAIPGALMGVAGAAISPHGGDSGSVVVEDKGGFGVEVGVSDSRLGPGSGLGSAGGLDRVVGSVVAPGEEVLPVAVAPPAPPSQPVGVGGAGSDGVVGLAVSGGDSGSGVPGSGVLGSELARVDMASGHVGVGGYSPVAAEVRVGSAEGVSSSGGGAGGVPAESLSGPSLMSVSPEVVPGLDSVVPGSDSVGRGVVVPGSDSRLDLVGASGVGLPVDRSGVGVSGGGSGGGPVAGPGVAGVAEVSGGAGRVVGARPVDLVDSVGPGGAVRPLVESSSSVRPAEVVVARGGEARVGESVGSRRVPVEDRGPVDGHVAEGHVAEGHVAEGHVAEGHVAEGGVAQGHTGGGPGVEGHGVDQVASVGGEARVRGEELVERIEARLGDRVWEEHDLAGMLRSGDGVERLAAVFERVRQVKGYGLRWTQVVGAEALL
ncbi:MAG: hypothetical protein JWN95_416, partial [Frankiales bacterium]|nr:hypothetical protein [Frankiales bacterium]